MSRATSHSKKKFEEKILNELNTLLRSEISDPRTQFVTLTSVELNKDYSVAKIFWDTFDSHKRGDSKKAIKGMATTLRSKLAQRMKLRHTPQLVFVYDSQFEDELKIEQLLNGNEKEE